MGIEKDFLDAINTAKKTTSGYKTVATVTRIDGGTVYVHIPGGVAETPATTGVDCSVGDTVYLDVENGTAKVYGNVSRPPTDDATASVAKAVAVKADATANDAMEVAETAGGTATKYITDTSNGIKVHREGNTLDYVSIDDDSVDIYKDGRMVASFGESVTLRGDSPCEAQFTADGFVITDGTDELLKASVGTGTSETKQNAYVSFYAQVVDDGNALMLILDTVTGLDTENFVKTAQDGIYFYHNNGYPQKLQHVTADNASVVAILRYDRDEDQPIIKQIVNYGDYHKQGGTAVMPTVVEWYDGDGFMLRYTSYTNGKGELTTSGDDFITTENALDLLSNDFVTQTEFLDVGYMTTGNAAKTTITNTMQNQYYIDLPKGTWIVTGFIGTSGTQSKATSLYYNLRQTEADNSAEMVSYYPASVSARAEITKIIAVADGTERWYLNSRFSTSGIAGTVMTLAHAGLTAVKIK